MSATISTLNCIAEQDSKRKHDKSDLSCSQTIPPVAAACVYAVHSMITCAVIHIYLVN